MSDAPEPISPCGACRQVLFEFSPDLRVDSYAGTKCQSWTARELLPAGFSGDVLL